MEIYITYILQEIQWKRRMEGIQRMRGKEIESFKESQIDRQREREKERERERKKEKGREKERE